MVKGLTVSSEREFRINKTLVHRIVRSLMVQKKFGICSMEINFVGQKLIEDINIKYLGHNFSTDIITFNYSGENDNLEGEIYISIPDARNNAQTYGVSLDEELLRLVVHGILHLLGFDDMEDKARVEMKREEDFLTSSNTDLIKNAVLIYGNKNS